MCVCIDYDIYNEINFTNKMEEFERNRIKPVLDTQTFPKIHQWNYIIIIIIL